MRLTALITLLFGSVIAFAADENVADKARQRLYDGGIDEQPLQVQASLFNPKIEAEKTGEGESAGATAPQGATMTVDEVPEE